MTVFAPSSYQELQQMLEDAMDITTGPVAIRWSRGAAAHAEHGDVGSGLSARKIRAGDGRAALLGFGQMLPAARMQRRSSPPKASTPPSTTRGSYFRSTLP